MLEFFLLKIEFRKKIVKRFDRSSSEGNVSFK